MASDTVPAAPSPTPPGPDANSLPAQPDGRTGAGPAGWLASALEPVDPARPTFTLNPTTDLPGGTADGAGADTLLPTDPNGSSATYHGGNDTDGNSDGADGKQKQETRVFRAWLLAGAERWRKGADARNKRLDVQKARAQAVQLKEAVNVTRTEKAGGGGTGSGSGGSGGGSGKGLGSKSNGGGRSGSGSAGGGSRNGSGNRGSSGGGSGAGGRGSKGSPNGASGSGSGSGGGSKGPSSDKAAHRGGPGLRAAARDRAADRIRNGKKEKNGGSDKHAEPAAAHRQSPGVRSAVRDRAADRIRNGPRDKTNTSGDGGRSSGKESRGDTKSGGTEASQQHGHDTSGHKKAPKGDASNRGGKAHRQVTTQTCGDDSGLEKKPKKTSPDTPGSSKAGTQDSSAKPADLTKPDGKGKETAKAPATTDTAKPGTGQQQGAEHGKRIYLQKTREAGYRDGSRIATVTAHAEAYKDGVKDGYGDTRQATAKEKGRLDKAHRDRQHQRQQPPPSVPPQPPYPPKLTQPPAPAPLVDLTKKPKNAAPAPATPQAPPKPAGTPVDLTKAQKADLNKRDKKPGNTDQEDPTMPQPEPSTEQPTWNAAGQTITNPAVDTVFSSDYHTPTLPAVPVRVQSVDSMDVHLVDDGNIRITDISRKEVRTLKQYERTLGAKATTMGRIAEATRALEAEDAEEEKNILSLLEAARSLEGGGGETVIAELARLHEISGVQVGKARELTKRALRGAEYTQTVLANVETRYGGIYKAVVDSPLALPEERAFYKENADA